MMGIKKELGGFFVAFILFVPTNALAVSVDGELEFPLLAQADCQSDTGECPEEELIEDEEEPDCE
jgi:hypothetical protein